VDGHGWPQKAIFNLVIVKLQRERPIFWALYS
jgi:hypothetical protein